MATQMAGKTALVTGATAGIGKETALGLLKLGAHVIIAGRNEAKTRAVVDELKVASGNSHIDFVLGDLSRLTEVRRLASEVRTRFPSLQVLVNNAGGVNLSRQLTAEGLELTFAMNHLSYFLLTQLLLPTLEQGAPARIVNVSSQAHRRVALDWGDLQAEKRYRAMEVYGRSKLMNILFTRALAARLQGKNITANSLHPGLVASNFMKKPGVFGLVGHLAMSVVGISPQRGALTSIYLASSPDVEGVSGQYFIKCQPRQPSATAQDDMAARRLWEISEKFCS